MASLRQATLKEIARQGHEIDRRVAQLGGAVRRARNQGATWREIGEALGVSAQAAQQRFRKVGADVPLRA